ncbi:MAG: hypothetical protein HYU97_11995 [Deltaproteobacteria bacterium]|nr:hypothetical protein [Deltaproteobacteria bacterium]
MNKIKRYSILIILFFFVGCGGGIITQENTEEQFSSTAPCKPVADDGKQLAGSCGSLNLGSLFPADIDIPNIDGMRDTAFITLAEPPYLVPIDLNNLQASLKFFGLDLGTLPKGSSLDFGVGSFFLSPTQGFLLTGASLVYFNPTSGQILQAVSLADVFKLKQPLLLSEAVDTDGDGDQEISLSGNFSPSFASDVVVSQNKVFVSMANLYFTATGTTYRAKGILRLYDLHDSSPYLTIAATPYLEVSGFNPTGLLLSKVGDLIITNSGDFKYDEGFKPVPTTPSLLDRLNTTTLTTLTSLNMGMVGLTFKKIAYAAEDNLGFIGSYMENKCYAIDLNAMTTVRGASNPIYLGSQQTQLQFISDMAVRADGELLAVASFNDNKIFGIDLGDANYPLLSEVLDFTETDNPGVTGVGPIAFRPGTPGTDFSGPDLFIIQASPGVLKAVQTY